MFSSTLKRNIGANFIGSIWQAIMGLVFVPVYIKFIGIESYGLIGVFATLQAMFGLLDIGLSSTLTREMARLSVLINKEQVMRNLVRTLEVCYWSIAIFVGITIILLSPLITHSWIKAGELPITTIEHSFFIMGFIMVFQMPIGFYSGGLMGLQKQVSLNVINICMSTLRGCGVILILWLVSPTIQAFLLWQLLISVMNALVLIFSFWNSLPISENKAIFQKQLFVGVWRFTLGMGGISILGVILIQMDKVILSKILSLEMFGYYMLANVVAMSLVRLVIPIFSGIYPKFVELVSINDQNGLKKLYHKSCQLISVIVFPVAIVVALFSYEIILLWTQNITTATNTHVLLSIMICGTALFSLMYTPYALQLAFGWTKLSFYKNIIAVIILLPTLIFMTIKFGAKGAASVWVFLNIGYVFFEIPIMHNRLLRKEKFFWYYQDVFIPFFTALFVAGIGRLFFNGITSQFMILLYLIIISILTIGFTSISVPTVRSILYNLFFEIKI